MESSPIQESLAQYGFNHIPEGNTFVVRHYRGEEIIYKSRSVSKYIFQEKFETNSPPVNVEWFQFERDVSNLLALMGLKVLHTASSKMAMEVST